ncbi:hypothetical protein Cgig2_003948 [Carnegiea gigantea]|uniref:PPM-type phosphatase domain-containing protein n=1 Tax=Carnegiea gigantea TaxID=171969 RepID=A0A9Q1KAW5_9CARY|nr:hypothetical protein Cgig2_003948 [Carnegiea gigantea]
MGNHIGKIGVCFTGGDHHRRPHRHEMGMYMPDPYDEGLGTAFCYVRPDPNKIPTSSRIHSEESSASIFRSISGASVSANTSTPPLSAAAVSTSGPIFESSTYFASVPLQPIPRHSGPLSGPITDRGFLSGPIERGGFLSGPLDRGGPILSGPLDRSYSHNGGAASGSGGWWRKGSVIQGLRRAISKTLGQNSVVAPVKWVLGHDSWEIKNNNTMINNENTINSGSLNLSLDEIESWETQNLQWAQGKAGEDRVQVVVSEEHGWVFVGIYDGFNGPDATDFLLSNLYSYVQKELKGLLWDDNPKSESSSSSSSSSSSIMSCTTLNSAESRSSSCSSSDMEASVSRCCESENYASVLESSAKRSKNFKGKFKGVASKWEENQRRWKCEWDRERLELDRRLKEQWNRNDGSKSTNHSDVLVALSQALKKTEEAYFDVADKMLGENPELALMGSCVLAMLMKGEDVYVMNVGDSRAVLAQNKEPDLRLGKIDQDLERINEESLYDFQVSDGVKPSLTAYQLTMDHSTSVEEEVLRIREEHPDDASAVVNDRVKGSLKVTRAFGAGFLKQYFTNEEAVAEVELFISLYPEGDPAQHLVEEVLFRAAKKAGMDFYELLEIPQGDRRKYHDDVSIIIISFEGRIWKSFVRVESNCGL